MTNQKMYLKIIFSDSSASKWLIVHKGRWAITSISATTIFRQKFG